MKIAIDVRSWPVGSGIHPGFWAEMNRVTAPVLSPIFSAIISKPKCTAAAVDAIAASSSPLPTNSAAADVEFVGTISACG